MKYILLLIFFTANIFFANGQDTIQLGNGRVPPMIWPGTKSPAKARRSVIGIDSMKRISGKGYYVNDTLKGPWTLYSYGVSDTVVSTGSFLNGKESGVWTSKIKKEVFKTTQYLDKDKSNVILYKNGAVLAEQHYIGKNERTGTWITYYHGKNSGKFLQGNFNNNSLEGKLTTWYPDGTLQSERMYNKGIEISSTCYSDKGTVSPECAKLNCEKNFECWVSPEVKK